MPNLFTLSSGPLTISAQPEYMESESSPIDSQYIWIYHIRIQNKGKEAVQLLNRYWHITDGKGTVQEVRGPGVVGLQPTILPGEDFTYTSSVSLSTGTGLMHGAYEFKTVHDEMMNASIPVFSLDSTDAIRMAN